MPHIFLGQENLIKQGDDKVVTNMSGLQICTRTYVVSKPRLKAALQTLTINFPDPANTNRFLYPAPETQMRDDGFVNIVCNFYGARSDYATFAHLEPSRELGQIRIQGYSVSNPDGAFGLVAGVGVVDAIVPLLRVYYVKVNGATPRVFEFPEPRPDQITPSLAAILRGDSQPGAIIQFNGIQGSWQQTDVQETNYGRWNEVVETYKYQA